MAKGLLFASLFAPRRPSGADRKEEMKKRGLFKLKYKAAILVLLVSLPCVAAIGTFACMAAKRHVEMMTRVDYTGSLRRAGQVVLDEVAHVDRDALFLGRTVFARRVAKAVGAADPVQLSESLRSMGVLFGEMMAVSPRYVRICLLGPSGGELLRIQRGQNGIGTLRLANLAGKATPGGTGDRTDPEGRLNVAVISKPRSASPASSGPLLRFVAPVLSNDARSGLRIAIDVSSRDFFNLKKMFTIFQLKDPGELFVVDAKGSYLHRCGKSSAAAAGNLRGAYPRALVSAILSGGQGEVSFRDRKLFYSTLPIADHFHLIIGLDSPGGPVEAPLRRFDHFLFYLIAATLLVTWILSGIFVKPILEALETLHEATRGISAGDFLVRVAIPGNDEFRDLGEGFNTMARAIWKKTEEIEDASREMVYRLLKAAESRDEDTGMHLQRMSRYAAAVARKLGLSREQTEAVLRASPMHDVGKIGVPDRILLKPGKLDPQEWEIMKRHTTWGARMLEGSRTECLKLAEVIALTHHERWDGSGYPRGLRGNQIPIEGRIVAIADVFDALTTSRPYKEAFPLDKALAIIRDGRGTHFDPEVVDAFFEIRDEIISIMEECKDVI